MTWPSRPAIIFALNGYLAVVLALYVAFALDLRNPWWAMATVFFTQPARPLVGAVWAKAFYRAAGTIAGAAAAVVLTPNLVNFPALMVLGLAGWIALCVFCGCLDRSPRYYLFMLSGYSAALIGLSTATHPETIFEVAVARTEEIIIGVLAAAIVQSMLFPRSVAAEVCDRLGAVMEDARLWIVGDLRTLRPGPVPRHIAAQLTEINLMATDWRFEGTLSGLRRRALRALEQRLIRLFALATAVEDCFDAIGRSEAPMQDIAAVTGRMADRMAPVDAEDVDRCSQDVEAIMPDLGPDSTWSEIVAAGLSSRLLELMMTWKECLLLVSVVNSTPMKGRQRIDHLLRGVRPRELHVDIGRALLSAAVAGLTVIAIAAFSIAIRWEDAPLTITIASMCCSLFAIADDPLPLIRKFLLGLILALPPSLLYEFAILPRVDGADAGDRHNCIAFHLSEPLCRRTGRNIDLHDNNRAADVIRLRFTKFHECLLRSAARAHVCVRRIGARSCIASS